MLRNFSLILLAVSLSSCAITEDFKTREAARAEEMRLKGVREEANARHAAFRVETGWKSRTYRDPAVEALLTPENTGIQVSLDDQRGLLMAGDLIAVDFPIASGKANFPTPKGSYTILQKSVKYHSNLYGKVYDAGGAVVVGDADRRSAAIPEGGRFAGASMPYWMRLTNTGVGLHVGYVPGRPASHGCIRMPSKIAPYIFEKSKMGTPVIVSSSAPVEWPKPEA